MTTVFFEEKQLGDYFREIVKKVRKSTVGINDVKIGLIQPKNPKIIEFVDGPQLEAPDCYILHTTLKGEYIHPNQIEWIWEASDSHYNEVDAEIQIKCIELSKDGIGKYLVSFKLQPWSWPEEGVS